MIPETSDVEWEDCCRIIPTRYPEERILDKVAAPGELEIVDELEQMTNERLRQERGDAAIVPKRDWLSGKPGDDLIMAAFTHRAPTGSRFSDGTWGVYYAAKDLKTAVEETRHHRETFMRATNERPMRLEMRVLTADLDAEMHDIRGHQKKFAAVYKQSDYTASQALARDLVKASSFGITYDSLRWKDGECAAVFRPRALSRCRKDRHFVFEWDGKKIERVYEMQEFKD